MTTSCVHVNSNYLASCLFGSFGKGPPLESNVYSNSVSVVDHKYT